MFAKSKLSALLLLLPFLFSAFAHFPETPDSERSGHWQDHPALKSLKSNGGRGSPMVCPDIRDSRILVELARRFRYADDIEAQQEYFLRLLDYLYFSKQPIVGYSKRQVERVFGQLQLNSSGQARINGGRDTLCLWFEDNRVIAAFYAMGY